MNPKRGRGVLTTLTAPARWDEHDREGAIWVPPGCPLLIIEGVGTEVIVASSRTCG
jgi:hypothetical protein